MAERRQLAERSALAAFREASREATGLLVSAERARRAAARYLPSRALRT